MNLKDQLGAALMSAARLFVTAAAVAYITLGKAPDEMALADLKIVLWAGVAAVITTAANWLRKGELRFGRGREGEAVREFLADRRDA